MIDEFMRPRYDVDYLQRAQDVIRKRLLQPLGLEVPILPITFDYRAAGPAALNAYLGYVDGSTVWPNPPIKPEVIFISPMLDRLTATSTLAHEMIHAAHPFGVGHGREFGHIARMIGLQGPNEATYPGPGFKAFFDQHLADL